MKISYPKKPDVPLSEDPKKQNYRATPEDTVKDLRRVAQLDPTKVVTRNYYRNVGRYAESVWTKYWGTFEEFKRQAGLKLSRQVHHLEKQIAKHASVSHYRQVGEERLSYGDTYARPANKRFQVLLIGTDFHDKEVDPFALRVFIDTAKRIQPDTVVLGGDTFDLPEFGKFTIDPREWDPVSRIKFVIDHIHGPLREACPNAQLDSIEGNHEYRLLRHLADATPAMKAVLADLHGMTVRELLGLNRHEINYIAKGDLSAYNSRDIRKELMRNYRVYHGSVLVHHFPEGRNLGVPGVCGHHHKFVAWPMTSGVFGAYNYYQLGAMHRRSATYTDGEKWSTGFMIAHVDTKTQSTCFEYVDIRDHAVVGGRYYYRSGDEV